MGTRVFWNIFGASKIPGHRFEYNRKPRVAGGVRMESLPGACRRRYAADERVTMITESEICSKNGMLRSLTLTTPDHVNDTCL